MPPVVLYTYQLRGRVLNAAGEPVRGAVVITRTLDRDFWTMSTPADASGRYASFFAASDRTEANPVPMNVQVAVGNTSYVFPLRARSASSGCAAPSSTSACPRAERRSRRPIRRRTRAPSTRACSWASPAGMA